MVKNLDTPRELDFLTWSATGDGVDWRHEASEGIAQLSEYLCQSGAIALQRRVYGNVDAAREIDKMINGITHPKGMGSEIPTTFVEGTPCTGGNVSGIHILAARASSTPHWQPVEWQGHVCGRIVEGANATYLFLWDIARHALTDDNTGPARETEAVFDAAAAILESVGWAFTDVCRTWFYLRDILDWYDDFNDVRNRAFRQYGLLGGAPNTMIPASTGIRGRSPRGNWCTLDLLAVRPAPGAKFAVQRLNNPQQNEAPDYGSAFSRGLTLDLDNSRLVLVSGTASIDEHGKSIHTGDFERQTEQTLDTVGALLAEAGATFENIKQATAFIKNPHDVPAYNAVMHRRGLKNLPVVCTIADVCRDELLFELDATAALTVPAESDANRCSG